MRSTCFRRRTMLGLLVLLVLACFPVVTRACETINCTDFPDQSTCVADINPLNFTALSPACVHNLTHGVLAELQAPQLSSIPNPSIQAFNATQLAAFQGHTCAGFTHVQAAAFTNTSAATTPCVGFSTLCIENLTQSATQGFDSECLSTLMATEVLSLSSTHTHTCTRTLSLSCHSSLLCFH